MNKLLGLLGKVLSLAGADFPQDQFSDSVHNKDLNFFLINFVLLLYPSSIFFDDLSPLFHVRSVSAESGELGGAVLGSRLPSPVAGQHSVAL